MCVSLVLSVYGDLTLAYRREYERAQLRMLCYTGGGAGVKHGKEEYIARLLRYLKEVWDISPKITLTDKDWSEIDACSQVFPDAEHQLCYWHVLRAIKQRLAIVKRRPRYYNVKEAMAEFGDFIDPLFVPIGQVDPADLNKIV